MTICRFPRWSAKHFVLFILDAAYNAIIVTPICVALWWSVWDLYLIIAQVMYTESIPHLGLWILLACGTIGKLSMYLLQPCFQPYVKPEVQSKLFIEIVLRIDLYIMFLFGMAIWVSLWTLLEELPGINLSSTTACLAIGAVGLISLQSLNNGISGPMNLTLDSNLKPFDYPMRLKADQSEERSRFQQCVFYFFNCFITATMIDYFTVCFWTGGFNMLNLYVLPNEPTISAFLTMGIGYTMFIILLFLQFPAANISKKISSSWQRLLYKTVYWMLTFIMMVCIWRGIWNLMDLHITLESLEEPYYYLVPLSAHICIVCTMFALNIINAGGSGFSQCDDCCLNGSDLLVKNLLPNVLDLTTYYAVGNTLDADPDETTALISHTSFSSTDAMIC